MPNKMGDFKFKFISACHSYLVDKIVLINLLSLGYMVRHKCHHQTLINFKNKKLSYIEFNAVSTEIDNKNNII
jgi:hypothetical protein